MAHCSTVWHIMKLNYNQNSLHHFTKNSHHWASKPRYSSSVRGHSTPFHWPWTSRRSLPMVAYSRLQLPMFMDTPLHPVGPKLLSVPSKSILLITTSPYYKYLWMDHSQPPQKLNRSNSELDPSKPFSLNFRLSLYFTFSSCFIFKLSATYIVWLYPSRDLSFSFRIPCYFLD